MTFYDVASIFLRTMFRVVWRVRLVGLERVPRDGPLIVVANHRSTLDPPLVGCFLPRPMWYMAKQELFRIPVLSTTIRHLNAFPVDRSKGDVSAVRRAVAELRSGKAVCVFPEGGRNRDGTAQARDGAALLASLSGAPILPVYVEGTDRSRRLARFTVTYGEPFHLTRSAEPVASRPSVDSSDTSASCASAESGGKQARRADLAKGTEKIMSAIEALRESGIKRAG